MYTFIAQVLSKTHRLSSKFIDPIRRKKIIQSKMIIKVFKQKQKKIVQFSLITLH